ncbi:MAG: EEP domain-containing protein [Gammaproteobacteria bacterium]|nr:EEP domain-containing protein [Gammaproteobacteria bacterium]
MIFAMKLRIVTFNIHKGVSANSRKHILPEIKSLLHSINPDIVFLQEVQGEHRKHSEKFADWPENSQLEFLANELWPHHFYAQCRTHKNGDHGNALLSKYPLNEVMNLDISSSRFSSRGLLYAQVQAETEGRPLHLICTHFGLLRKERAKQFSSLNEFIAGKIPEEEALIIAGDFNDWRLGALELLERSLNLKEVFHEQEGVYAKTFPAQLPLLSVDRIYYRGIHPTDQAVIPTIGLSDHLPLMAEFEVK